MTKFKLFSLYNSNFLTIFSALLQSSEDAKRYVETLLEVHRRYAALVKMAFNDDADFAASLDKVRALCQIQQCEKRASLQLYFPYHLIFSLPLSRHHLSQACRTFINNNAVTKASKASRSPELLAKYCDSLLKKSTKSPEEQQLESLLVDIMTIFCYLDDKDVFEKFYKKFLANRLVTNKSVSDDAESSMISKLKVSDCRQGKKGAERQKSKFSH